jgi:hypothetical protein
MHTGLGGDRNVLTSAPQLDGSSLTARLPVDVRCSARPSRRAFRIPAALDAYPLVLPHRQGRRGISLLSGLSLALAVESDSYAYARRQCAVPQKVTATATAGETA